LSTNIGASTVTADGFDEEREWVRGFWSALEPHFTTVYVNLLMDEGEEPDPTVLRPGEVRAAGGAEAEVRPRQLLPA